VNARRSNRSPNLNQQQRTEKGRISECNKNK